MIGLRPSGRPLARQSGSGRSRGHATAVVENVINALSLWRFLTVLRIFVAAILALVAAGVSLQAYDNTPIGFPDTGQELRAFVVALATALIVGVVTPHVEHAHGRRRSVLVAVVLAYLGTRLLSEGLIYPGSLSTWSPYPILGWLSPGWLPLVCILAQAWLLRPMYPIILRISARVPLKRHRAQVRKLSSLIVCALVFASWDWISGAVGAASAAFFCALAMVVVILLVGDRRYALLGALACAGFLSVSSLVQEAPPSNVLVIASPATPEIDFAVDPPAGTEIDTAGLQLHVILDPLLPTLFGCPAQVDVEVFIDDANQKAQEQLNRARYALTVPGTSVIYWNQANPRDTATVSTVLDAPGRLSTQILGDGLHVGNDPGNDSSVNDEWVFSVTLQSWRSMGTCYVTIPTVNKNTSPYGYSIEPAEATMQLSPWAGSTVDLTDTTPQPTADQATPGAFDWTCYDYTPADIQANGQCPAVSVVTAAWANSYAQVALLLVGALIAIVAEGWFRSLEPDDESDDGEPSQRQAD